MSVLAVLLMALVAVVSLIGYGALRARVGTAAPSIARKAPASSSVPTVVAPNAKYMDCTIREGSLTAADTWVSLVQFNAVTEGPVDVPVDAKYLAGMEIAIAVEQAGAVSNKISTVVRLSGSALKDGGRYHFLGPVGSAVVLSANGGNMTFSPPCNYPLAIPLKGANQLTIEAMFPGDDPTDIFIMVRLLFSDQPAPGGFSEGDVREADLAAVNTDYTLTNVGGDALGNFRVPVGMNTLAAIAYACPFDPGVAAAVLKLACAFQLRGDALTYGGTFRFLAPCGTYVAAGTPVGGQAVILPPTIMRVDLPVKAGNTLEAHAILLAEDPGDAEGLVGVLYA